MAQSRSPKGSDFEDPDGALREEAFEGWLHSPSQRVPPESGVELRAAEGHSPSARIVANVADLVVQLAEADASQELPRGLGDRIAAALGVPDGVSDKDPAAPSRARASAGTRRSARVVALRPPNEALGLIHANDAAEVERSRIVRELGLRGPFGENPGREAPTDAALLRVIDQAAPLLAFEIVYVSAVDGGETIHRMQRGLPEDLRVVPRELSFCTHTLSAREPFVVEDASKEAFFRSSELVRGLGARAYVGIPLILSGDMPILGSFCGLSRSPQRVEKEDVALMGCFAQVALALVSKDRTRLERVFADPPRYPEKVTTSGAPEAGAPMPRYAEATFDMIVAGVVARLASPSKMASEAFVVDLPDSADVVAALAEDHSLIVGRSSLAGRVRVLTTSESVSKRLAAHARDAIVTTLRR